MKKTSTILVNGNMIFKGHKLTIGLDLGDRWSCYFVNQAQQRNSLANEASAPEELHFPFTR